MPIELDLIFSDGSRERRHWAGHEAVRAEEVSGPKRLTGAVIDPQYRVRIDDNLLNNAATTQPPSTSAVAERLSYYAALLLSLFGP
jgi:hypothetical protein